MNYLQISIELISGFFGLLILTHLLGKTQLSQLTPFDFISAIVLGELLGNAVYDKEIGLRYILYALVFWGTLIYLVEIIGLKFIFLRSFFEGAPSIVIKDGQIDRQQLKKNKIGINQLLALLRQNDVFSLREVAYAILEPSGKLSVLKLSSYSTPKQKDLNLPSQTVHLPFTVISDGKVLWENVNKHGHNKAWLDKKLADNGINNYKDVFYAEWLDGDGMHVVLLK
ncbi:MAG: DUF421 domain-containing protein [Bacillota bacterium]